MKLYAGCVPYSANSAVAHGDATNYPMINISRYKGFLLPMERSKALGTRIICSIKHVNMPMELGRSNINVSANSNYGTILMIIRKQSLGAYNEKM